MDQGTNRGKSDGGIFARQLVPQRVELFRVDWSRRSAINVPDEDGGIGAAGGQELAVCRKDGRAHLVHMPLEEPALLAGSSFQEADAAVFLGQGLHPAIPRPYLAVDEDRRPFL